MGSNSELIKRIRNPKLREKIVQPEEIIPLFKDGMILGLSGFVEGHPKKTGRILADYVEKNNLQGQLKFTVLAGASVGMDIDDRWAELDMINARFPFQWTHSMRKKVNRNEMRFADMHLSRYAQENAYGFYTLENDGKIDIAVIEASCITEDGCIVPTLSGGILPETLYRAEKVIIEISTKQPSFEGLHDFIPVQLPPNAKPLGITKVSDRIGTTSVPCDPNKIIAIIESDMAPLGRPMAPPDEKSSQCGEHLLEFFKHEVKMGRLPKNLLPLQSGGGFIANAVFMGLARDFSGFNVWSEVIQDGFLDLLDDGKIESISCAGTAFTDDGLKRLLENLDEYSKKLIIRQATVTNSPEMIRRLGLICMNTPLEFDIYANVNSSVANGTAIVNGLGGSGDFMRNGYLSIMHTPSTRPTKTDPDGISCVVPFASHIDHTEHEMHILVTEQGLADLRGLVPRERAQVIIDNCAHPDYRPQLQEYFDRASRECLAKGRGYIPHMLSKAFRMHQNVEEHGTMKIDSWD